MTKTKSLQDLNQIGQSIWYDNLSKDVLESGQLASYIAQGVSGLTSNPSIFKAAIADSDDYDADLVNFKGQSAEAATEELMLKDVINAADLMLDTYNTSEAADGYVSIEVSPELAYDTDATIKAAEEIWEKAQRPNLMIKIPATKEGLPAIQTTLEKGINVNVTLIFSNERYVEVAKAYIAAIDKRVSNGEDVSKLASVASFFVSRLDALVEKSLTEAGKPLDSVLGKVGVDNSLLAYKSYQELFESDLFKELANKGAMVQRPLWASTSTKNPEFDPLLYVKTLALPNTVNTIPTNTLEDTLKAEGFDSALSSVADSGQYVATCTELGLNFNSILKDLEEDGVRKFSESYQQLLQSVQQELDK